MKFIIKRASDTPMVKKQPVSKSYWDDEVKEWCIDVDNLENFINITEEEGAIVLFPPCGGDLYEIVIYDAYLE